MKRGGPKVLHENYKLLFSGHIDSRHGVSVLLALHQASCVEKVQQVLERIISVSVKTQVNRFSLIQVRKVVLQSSRPTQ